MGLLIVIILIFIIINYIGSNNNSDYKTNTSNKYDSGVTSNKYNPKVNNKKSDSQITSTYYIDSGKAIYNGTVSFEGNLDIKEVIVSGSVTSIRPFAFATCRNLKKVEIRSLVTSIGNSAFAGCSNLKEIKIPNSIRTIGEYAFAGCSSLDEWNESCIYFEKNHSWLAEHPCTSQKVEEKILREDKCTPEEIMLEEVDNMIKIIERYLGNQKK